MDFYIVAWKEKMNVSPLRRIDGMLPLDHNGTLPHALRDEDAAIFYCKITR